MLRITTMILQPNLNLNLKQKRRIHTGITALPLCNLNPRSHRPLVSLLSTRVHSIKIRVTLSNRHKIYRSRMRLPRLPPSQARSRNSGGCSGQMTEAIHPIFRRRCGRDYSRTNTHIRMSTVGSWDPCAKSLTPHWGLNQTHR